jgi:lysophospholipase L1-like esterase
MILSPSDSVISAMIRIAALVLPAEDGKEDLPIVHGARYYAKVKIFKKRLNSGETLSLLELINRRPIPPDSFKVMFIGNSLTLHGFLEKVWNMPCGMAASSPEKDFVHLVAAGIQKTTDKPVEILYNNGGNGKIREMVGYLRTDEFSPDLVVIQGGENDRFDSHFKEYYLQLIDYFQCPKIVLGDWFTKEKSDYSQWLCVEKNIPFVSLYSISRNEENMGDGGPYRRKDVAVHPNDSGMAAIAEGVLHCFDRLCTENSAFMDVLSKSLPPACSSGSPSTE